jgi:MoxR-like ATPase
VIDPKNHPSMPGASATTLAVPIGPRVVELLDVAYRARRPVLLEGPTGIGKSQIVAELGRSVGLEIVVLDLSLLEPPDLVGLPVIENGRTRYASPAELPSSGRGVLMLEELNRAELPVMQPALQLLSARRLHGYELPPGWSCIAAVNPEGGDYQVTTLDPALRSRFMQLSVCADRDQWLAWAARANVHPVIAGVVRAQADAFDHASPRSWSYASDVLHAMRASELADRDLVRVALRGYLPTSWALAVTSALASRPVTIELEPELVLSPRGAGALAAAVASLEAKTRSDAVAMLATKVRCVLASPLLAERARAGDVTMTSLEALLAPFPGDLREQCLDTAAETAPAELLASLGHDPGRALAGYASSALRKDVQAWAREGRTARVRLVVLAATRTLADADAAQLAALGPLVIDAGPAAHDLARWLGARGVKAGA